MNTFVFLPPARFQYGAASTLFKIKEYQVGKNVYRDFQCMGCENTKRKAKAGDMYKHGITCPELREFDEDAVNMLEEQMSDRRASKTVQDAS